jgi:hypothetical protein
MPQPTTNPNPPRPTSSSSSVVVREQVKFKEQQAITEKVVNIDPAISTMLALSSSATSEISPIQQTVSSNVNPSHNPNLLGKPSAYVPHAQQSSLAPSNIMATNTNSTAVNGNSLSVLPKPNYIPNNHPLPVTPMIQLELPSTPHVLYNHVYSGGYYNPGYINSKNVGYNSYAQARYANRKYSAHSKSSL